MLKVFMTVAVLSATPAVAEEARQWQEADRPVDAPVVVGTEGDDVDCFSAPGRSFCRELREFRSALVPCSGALCYPLWDEQLAAIEDMEDWYYDTFDGTFAVDRDMGLEIRDAAISLCSTRHTGDPRYLAELALSYNTILAIWEDLQKAAGIRIPYGCRFRAS